MTQQSRLFVFNSTCELAVENGMNHYTPPNLLKKFEEEISSIITFLGNEKDYIYSEKEYDKDFILFWEKAGKLFPKQVTKSDLPQLCQNTKLTPWGWSKAVIHQFKEFCTIDKESCPFINLPSNDFKNLFSRNISYEIIHLLKKNEKLLPKIALPLATPQKFYNEKDLYQFYQESTGRIVLKTLWSASGRGIHMIRSEEQWEQSLSRIRKQIKKNEYILAEPYFFKVQDASYQIMILEDGSYQPLGINYFDATENGKFESEHIGIPSSIKNKLPQNEEWIEELGKALIETLKKYKLHEVYRGSVGIDMLFYEDENNRLKVMPFLEANLRNNMGLVNLALKKHVAEQSEGFWKIEHLRPGQWRNFCMKMMKDHPLSIRDNRIAEGFFPLTPFDEDYTFGAWGLIKKQKNIQDE